MNVKGFMLTISLSMCVNVSTMELLLYANDTALSRLVTFNPECPSRSSFSLIFVFGVK